MDTSRSTARRRRATSPSEVLIPALARMAPSSELWLPVRAWPVPARAPAAPGPSNLVRRELGRVHQHRDPPVMRGRDDLAQRRQPARHVTGARDRQQPRHRPLVERGREISGLEGALPPALDIPAGRRARPGQQVGVMLGDRGDHDIAGAQPQLAGQVMDSIGRVLADDRDITRIWPAPGERQRGKAGALVSQDRRLGLVAGAVTALEYQGRNPSTPSSTCGSAPVALAASNGRNGRSVPSTPGTGRASPTRAAGRAVLVMSRPCRTEDSETRVFGPVSPH